MSQNITQQIQVVQRSEIGLKRAVNQDSIGVRLPKAGEASQHALFVVADGVGGNLPKGEVASRTAIEAMFAYYYAESDETDILTRVGDALQDTNIAVREQALAEGVNAIGTTIVGIAIAPSGEAIGFNVGDSRLYRIRAREIELISEDQVSTPEPGVLKDEFKTRRVTKISSYIGQPSLLEPNFYRLKTQPGDIYLLCSDGVWSKFQDEELLQNIDLQPLDQASERIVRLVYERGAPDNLSVILIQLGAAVRPRTLAEPIGEMATAITPKPIPAVPVNGGGGRSMTPLIIGVVVLAAIIGALLLLNKPSAVASVTPTAGTIAAVSSAMVPPSQTVVSAGATKAEVTQTSEATTEIAVAIKASDTARPTTTITPSPRATATVVKTNTPSHTPTIAATVTIKAPTATPTLSPTRRQPSTPTTAPSVEALVMPTDTATAKASPTVKPSATHTEAPSDTPTREPSATPTLIQPTTTLNPTLITYTPTPRPTSTPTLTPTLTPTPSATATHTATPTVTATSSATPTNTATLTLTPSPTLTATITQTPTATYTPSLTANAQQAAQTSTAQARITPTAAPTLYAPHDNDVITLAKPVMFYPSTDTSSFSLPSSGGVELPANTVVKVVSSQPKAIDGLIYSYVTLQSKVDGVSAQTGWTALANAAQATVTAHIKGGISIRRGPSQLYDRAGIGLKDGEQATIIGQAIYRKQLWFYIDPVNPQSSPGWIYAGVKGLQIDGNTSNVPTRTYAPEPTITPSPIPSATETPVS